ncbi:peptide-methionine (S)-S-oxide reductase MsrA [Halopseudomonas pelagia]|uniref:peptide-methionine (S)-S-oxide reductase MsrA n=1 Tax=Halopseudomonas pelagia TaxID=553151 RepID=UPI0030DB6F44|tara:strand:- start:101 stop:748 length:648 start_codon:yes stop_codon:yes gene_type:complete
MFFRRIPEHKLRLPSAEEALPGRDTPIASSQTHCLLGTPLHPPFPTKMQQVIFGLGCFWGAERMLWRIPGVYTTAAGYCGGITPNPTYEEACSGMTGHNEVVLVVFDPEQVSLETLFKHFWESHDPTQGMRQGNDTGTQYRSGIYVSDPAQQMAAEVSKARYADLLQQAGKESVTTEIRRAPAFYYAEDYHQQYLHKNPGGYCSLAGTGICLPPN